MEHVLARERGMSLRFEALDFMFHFRIWHPARQLL
jgi:hypothetical protein